MLSFVSTSLLKSLSILTRCESGYSCDLTTDNWDVCWSILSTKTTAVSHDAGDFGSPPSLGPTMTVTSLPIYVQAYAIQVRFQPSDLSILPPSITPGEATVTVTASAIQGDSFSATGTSTSTRSDHNTRGVTSGLPASEKIAISVSTIGGILFILSLILICILRRRRMKRITDSHHVKPKKLSWWSTLDKLLLSANLLLAALGVLAILNGRCSRPHGLTAEAPVCIGGSLSIQTWLAVTGVEFSLLGAFLVPRLITVFISKLVTRRLTGRGTNLATLLNSQPTAPLGTQMLSGSAGIFIFRTLAVWVGIAVSILYKFSYTQVDIRGSTAVAGSNSIDFTTRSYGHSPFENGLIDSITGNPLGTRDFQNGSQYDPYTFLVGPELNISSVPRLLGGTAYTCYPVYYLKNIVTKSLLDGEDLVINATQPFNDGVRIFSSQTDPDVDTIVDIYTDNHTMIAIGGYFRGNKSTSTRQTYSTVYTVVQQACAGYLSWNNSLGYQDYTIESPSDVSCVVQPFDIGFWRARSIGKFALAIINASIFDSNGMSDVDGLWRLTRNTILPTTDISFPELQEGDWPNVHRSPVHPACVEFYDDPEFKLVPTGMSVNGVDEMTPANDSKFWDGQIVVVGLIQGAGTGMTGLGIALQGVVVLLCVLGMLVLLWTPLPLLSEWPGQWLALASRLDTSTIRGNLKGVSIGKGRVSGETMVWLASSNLDAEGSSGQSSSHGESPGTASLVLKEEKGSVLREAGHV